MNHLPPLFEEQQQFRQSWLWALVTITIGGALVGAIAAFQSMGPNAEPWEFLVSLLMVVVVGAVWLLLWKARLVTTLTTEGIRYRFHPFHLREHEILWRDVEKAFVRTYRPIIEYGGWGIRYGMGLKGKAYNVSGNKGLQLVLKGGKRVLFGTQQPDRLALVLQSACPQFC